MKLSRKRLLIGGAILILFIILIIVGKKNQGKGLEVNVTKMEQRTIIETVSANGKIKPEEEVKISADVSGEITELYVKEGDSVLTGQLLLTIDPDLYITAVDRAMANVQSSQSTLNTNKALLTQAKSRFTEQKASFERNKKLYDDKVISQAEFDAASAAYEIAESDVKAAEERIMAAKYGVENANASLREAKKNLDRTKIYAPTDGIVSALNNEKGERVVGTAQMAGTEIMVISNLNNIEVIVDVNENDILQITKGDTAEIEVDAYRDRTFKGVVSEISRSASGSGALAAATEGVTNFEVKVRILKSSYEELLESTDAPFLTGMSASVEIQTQKVYNIPCLPIECVSTRIRETGDSTVKSEKDEEELDEVIFTIKDGKAVKHIITTGIQDSRYIHIVTEMEENAQIISGPYDAVSRKLEDGMEVVITTEKKDYKLEE